MVTTADCTRVITGGVDGQVRVWKLGKESRAMEITLKEHKSELQLKLILITQKQSQAFI